jgi:uncharacterized alpha/beta hydrolase family protein
MKLNFGIDFDDTITEDIDCFGKIFKTMQEAGHNVIVVTGRSKIGNWETEVYKTLEYLQTKYDLASIPVVFAGSEWKKQAAKNAGYPINIWMDNSPEYIDQQYILHDMNIGEKENHLSPETSGRIKKAMEESLKTAWEKTSEELKIYPKRLENGPDKEKLWSKINNEAEKIIEDYTK